MLGGVVSCIPNQEVIVYESGLLVSESGSLVSESALLVSESRALVSESGALVSESVPVLTATGIWFESRLRACCTRNATMSNGQVIPALLVPECFNHCMRHSDPKHQTHKCPEQEALIRC